MRVDRPRRSRRGPGGALDRRLALLLRQEAVRLDPGPEPGFADRVLARIAASEPTHTRGRGRRGALALGLAALVALLVLPAPRSGPLAEARAPGWGPAAYAGPEEARSAWDDARRMVGRSWRERALALRRVRQEAGPHDGYHGRALAAEARVLRDAARVHGAAALEARATAAAPEHDEDAGQRRVAQARALLEEEDRAAARPLFDAGAAGLRRHAPWLADEALEGLARLLAEDGEREALRRLADEADAQEARASTRIALWGAAGLACLAEHDRDEARRALARAERAYEAAARSEAREAARAAQVWLDLPLRKRLGG